MIDSQIKKAYEEQGLTPQAIADDMQLAVESVKAKLMSISNQYRKACGMEEEEDTLNFSKDELRNVNRVIYETALSAELPDGSPDYRVRLQAATYVRDDFKGRKEPIKHLQNNGFNLLQFNQTVLNATNKAQDAIKSVMQQKTIEA